MNVAYYSEIDPFAAAWLEELIKDGLIMDGVVDTRSIEDVLPSELKGFTRCHFFAGIGGWDYALQLAGWPVDRPIWTGSCPCQPFSAAGQGAGFTDERHLWPSWFHLIRECRPATICGEQVEAAIAHGWLDLVHDDLENEGYAVGAVGLPAASVGAPHIRQRLWFMADRHTTRRGSGWASETSDGEDTTREQPAGLRPLESVADPLSAGRPERRTSPRGRPIAATGWEGQERHSAETGVWRDLQWLSCRDGKSRPTQSSVLGIFDELPAELGYLRDPSGATILSPLTTGATNRIGRLRGYGNAIVPEVAAEVIKAYMNVRGN